MSHLTLEYSANLREDGNFAGLCRELAEFMCALEVDGAPIFPPGGVRVRAIPCEEFCIADGRQADAGFVHANLKIGAGRSEAAQRAVAEGVFDIIKAHFVPQFAAHGLALSLEVNEFSEAGTLKHNNLHRRFKRP